jgi:hypothetical protein
MKATPITSRRMRGTDFNRMRTGSPLRKRINRMIEIPTVIPRKRTIIF